MEIANDSFELGVFIDHSFFSKFVEDILSCSSGEGEDQTVFYWGFDGVGEEFGDEADYRCGFTCSWCGKAYH